MTRKEQIEKQADIYTNNSSNYMEWDDDRSWVEANDIELVKKAFIEGAKWADEHPNKDLKKLLRKAESYDKLVNKGLVNIEEVCKWLSDNMKNYAAFDSDIIKDLKKQWRIF